MARHECLCFPIGVNLKVPLTAEPSPGQVGDPGPVELEQRLLERTAQLHAVNEELQALSYSIAHDLRAPLRRVVGFVQLLEREASPSLSNQSRAYMAAIAQSINWMDELVGSLLTFSRVGFTGVQKSEVDLGWLVRQTMDELKHEATGRNIVWDIQPLPMVQADQALLRLVIVNLMANAIKFTRERQQARIEISCLPDAIGETVIFIRDNGAGFDPRYAGKLFGVFQRLHSAEKFEGTGIGLASVQRIIRCHGGRTWAEGAPGIGATFYFSIPKENKTTHEITTPYPAPGG